MPIAKPQRVALKVCADAPACAGWMLVAQGGVMPILYPCTRNSTMVLCLFLSITAVAWGEDFAELERRADRGNSDAEFRMGLEYAVGQRVPLDLEQAARWYRKAAGHGNPLAQYNLGIAYH
ncbi:MAG: hypothetical protein WB679_24945, partial [Terracidiphilus sp.]